MLKKLVFVLVLVYSSFFSFSQLQWPSITTTTKPWTRWWWEGSAVTKKNLTWNLEQFQKAGLGGVEITPIYGVHGYEQSFIKFLSPGWIEVFLHTLNESKRLGLGVDLANATGWPFGGPWVKDEDASKTIYYKTYTVIGGGQLKDLVEYQQEALVRTANNKPASVDTIQQPVSANSNLQSLALDQIVFPGKLPLQTLMAYGDKGEVIDLTSKVDHTGKLQWTAPAGKWTLYALFLGLHGKMVERAAPGGEGYAIDHFSSKAAKDYFKRFDEAFQGKDISYLRAFFNDSYEVDDARGQANWTPDFFQEFKKRRGYDLKANLPALFGNDGADKNARVLYDYRSTIDELLLEHFTQQWKKWGATKGAMVRNQSHGSPANTLDLYDAVDIPETEGTDILRFKFATSAANVGGKPLASSESCTWLNEHFLSSWGDVKKAIDLYFLGGVNHIFYHGSEYSPKDAPWPGWLFYAAVHFQPTNPQWKDFGTLNNYITRVQSFLQKGRPDNDVLLYYPLVDRYSEPGRDLLQHFDGMEKNFEGTNFEHVSKWMLEKGYGFDFFSDRQLKKFKVSGSSIQTGGNSYRVILLPANKLISTESLSRLVDLAKAGATVLVYKNLPTDVPGWNDLAQRRKQFQSLHSQLSFNKEGKLKKANIGKGVFLVGDDMSALMDAARVRNENVSGKGLSFIRRKSAEGTVYFIDNRSDKPFDDWVSLNAKSKAVALFDPMFGKSGLAKWRKRGDDIEVRLQLQPYESVIVQTYNMSKNAAEFKYTRRSGEALPVSVDKKIKLQFISGGPKLPTSDTVVNNLVSWTELNDAGKNFSGVARYSISFEKPKDSSKAFLLDLGRVHETAEVQLSGKKLATLIGPNFQVVIPAAELKQNNDLVIIVANLMANRISYMDRNNLPWKIFYNTNMPARKRENVGKNGLFDASSWKPLPSGLLGPVTLTPISYE
ncbi:MAG TPA: glycosyl hydrolase [Flavisolibacter sp.]